MGSKFETFRIQPSHDRNDGGGMESPLVGLQKEIEAWRSIAEVGIASGSKLWERVIIEALAPFAYGVLRFLEQYPPDRIKAQAEIYIKMRRSL